MDCGCKVWKAQSHRPANVQFCPLHAAAQETASHRDQLLEAAKEALAHLQSNHGAGASCCAALEAAIAEGE